MLNDMITDGAYHRDHKRRRLRRKLPISRHINNFIHGIFSVTMISSMLAVIIVTVYHEEQNFTLAVDNIEKWEDNVNNLASQVGDTTTEVENCALNLYITVNDCVRGTNNEALIRLCERALPETPEAFQSNMTTGMISILAFLETHDDIKFDVTVAQALYDLETTQTYRNMLISRYNESVDSYNFWVSEYRDSWIYRNQRNRRIETKTFVKYALTNNI